MIPWDFFNDQYGADCAIFVPFCLETQPAISHDTIQNIISVTHPHVIYNILVGGCIRSSIWGIIGVRSLVWPVI